MSTLRWRWLLVRNRFGNWRRWRFYDRKASPFRCAGCGQAVVRGDHHPGVTVDTGRCWDLPERLPCPTCGVPVIHVCATLVRGDPYVLVPRAQPCDHEVTVEITHHLNAPTSWRLGKQAAS